MGAEPVEFPTIKIVGPESSCTELDRSIKRLSTYDYLILTSVNGVKYFFERLYKLGLDVRELKGVKICAIGPMTAADRGAKYKGRYCPERVSGRRRS